MKDYTVQIEGFLMGRWRSKGSTISLTERQAETFLTEGRIAPAQGTSRKAKSEKAD